MATVIKTGRFLFNTSGTGITIDLTGWGGGTPIAMMLIGQDGTAADTLPVSATQTGCVSYGFSDGTHNVCMSGFAGSAASNANGSSYSTSSALKILTAATPTVGTGGTITTVAFSNDTIQLTQDANAATAWACSYVIFGGTDITNAFVGHDTCRTGTGTQTISNVAFRGDVVFTMCSDALTTATGIGIGLGAATSSSSRWAASAEANNGASMASGVICKSYINGAAVITLVDSGFGQGAGTLALVGDFTGFTSNGFTLNWTTALGGVPFGYLVLKGGQWAVGVNTPSSSVYTISGLAFAPVGHGSALTDATADATITANADMHFGACDATASDDQGAGLHVLDASVSTTKNPVRWEDAGLANDVVPGTTTQLTTTAYQSQGFTATWSSSGTEAWRMGWWAAGSLPPSTNRLGIFSKESVLAVGGFDTGIPIAYGLFDDDFVAQFSGTTIGATATGMSSVPVGVFDRDSQVTPLGLYGAN